jgi:hypothetical protein
MRNHNSVIVCINFISVKFPNNHHACLSSLGDSGSILGRISTRGLKIIEEKVVPFIDISKWLDFLVFSDKNVNIVGTCMHRSPHRKIIFKFPSMGFE